MKLTDLQVGDILFTFVGGKPPALHTQIYTGSSHFKQTILHAVDDSRPGGPSKLMATGIKTPDMLVYRCKRSHLAYEAFAMALRWARFMVPYDQDRKTLKEGYRNTIPEGTDLVKLMDILFHTHGIFRAIKYTARREEILCYPSDGESPTGLTCTMFVILCYQAAALQSHVLTTQELYPGAAMVRVSDKKMTREDIAMLEKMTTASKNKLNPDDLALYKDYVMQLQSGNEYEIDWDLAGRSPSTRPSKPRVPGYRYVPSLLCWKATSSIRNFPFAEEMTAGMMVDAKITTSEQLRLCLEHDALNWKNHGPFDESESAPVEVGYKQALALHEQRQNEARDSFRPKTLPRSTHN